MADIPFPAIVARAQFVDMFQWLERGWRPRPQGHRCQHCGGPLWGKQLSKQRERFVCTSCGIGQDVIVR